MQTTGRAPSLAFVGKGNNVRLCRQHHNMDQHDHARHLSEGCVESVAWRTSDSSIKGLVMMVHLYVAVFMVRFRALASNQ